jgi:uncharacterized SAM-binding protein YcdF (DUF218 family)
MGRIYSTVWRVACRLIVVFAIMTIMAMLFPQPILTIESGPVQADALVVLGGGSTDRPDHAADLFRNGEAPRVLVSGAGDCWRNAQWLKDKGVPAEDITVESGSLTTLENAKFSVPLLRQMGAHRVIIVTSWYHARRAMACFEHIAPDLRFYSRPSYVGSPYGEWLNQGTPGYVLFEMVKLPGYLVWHGVSPWPVAD